MKFVAPTWEELLEKSIDLATRIRSTEQFQFDCIVGVSRGGLALTRIISDLLDIQNVLITRCEYYTDVGKKLEEPVITQKIQGNITKRNVLVVDDVADTGESLIVIKKYLQSKRPKSVKIATAFKKPWTKLVPDYFAGTTDAWIIFPWEYYETIRSLTAANGKSILRRSHIPPRYIELLYRMDKTLGEKIEVIRPVT